MNDNELILFASLVVDFRYQMRAAMNEDAIADYADAIRQAGGRPWLI
jgi:hypothetical protein